MEADRDQTRTEDREDTGRLARLAAEVRGLVDDVRTWIDLKLKLLEVHIEERVRDAINRVVVTVVIATLVFLSVVFVLVTAALALGTWWENTVLGFLAVTLALVAVTMLLYVLRPALLRRTGGGEPARREAVGRGRDLPRLGEARTEKREETSRTAPPEVDDRSDGTSTGGISA